ncbi:MULTISPECIES: hypothetical protein [unclassified Bradyrhizobium]
MDQERNRLIGDLDKALVVKTVFQIKGIGPTLNGRNGEGDSSAETISSMR